MFLQRLKEYADLRLKSPPTLYVEGPLRYVIDLNRRGQVVNPIPTDNADAGNRQSRRGVRRLLPQVVRSSGVKPLLLADKADYVLGYVPPGGKADRVGACHVAFLDIVDRCAAQTGEPAVQAVSAFLHDGPLDHVQLPSDFDPSGIITFRVEGALVIDMPSVQGFWADEHDPARGSAKVMQCLICGQQRPVVDSLQAKIKGVPGGQSVGTSIISANADAFESYGLERSLGAPTCAACGERFTQGLNDLIARRESHISMGGAVFIFWTREDVGFNPFTFLDRPEPEDVRALYESVTHGKRTPEVDDTAFYAASLSGSGGRAVVRDWIDTTVGNAKEHLARWHRLQQIVGRDGGEGRPLGLYALAAATVRDANKELAPPTPWALLRAAFTETPIPVGLMEQAIRRCRAEQGVMRVTQPRAALIKLVLASNEWIGEDEMTQLDPANTDPGYRCGRLLAVLEEIQRAALGDISATIVDRYYGTASSAPASVFSRLLRGAQPHLSKLERDRPGTHYALQDRLTEVLSGVHASGFPRTLTLEQQGRFALGYYHQRADDRAQARARTEQRRQSAEVPSGAA